MLGHGPLRCSNGWLGYKEFHVVKLYLKKKNFKETNGPNPLSKSNKKQLNLSLNFSPLSIKQISNFPLPFLIHLSFFLPSTENSGIFHSRERSLEVESIIAVQKRGKTNLRSDDPFLYQHLKKLIRGIDGKSISLPSF